MASIKLKGDTSGEVTISAPAVAGTTTLELPATSSTLATQNALGVRNLIINGDMRISQRGTSFTSNLENTYTLDRWRIHDRNCTSRSVTQETFAVGSVSTFGKEIQNYLRATFSNDSGTTPPFIMQPIEDVRSVAGETVTISFWAKADSAQDIELHYSQQFGGGGSSEVTAIIDTFTLTTSWAKYTTTVTIPSISGKTVGTSSNLRIDWRMPANTAITYDMTLVQLEVGDTATPFEHRPYDMELLRCKRYFERFDGISVPSQTISVVDVGNRPETYINYYKKRANPTITGSTDPTIGTMANSFLTATNGPFTYVGTYTESALLFYSVASGVSTNSLSGINFVYLPSGKYINIDAEL